MYSIETSPEVVIQNSHQLVEFAKTFLGTPFSWEGFTCWDFVKKVYARFEIPMHVGSSIEPIADFDDPRAVGRLVLLRRREYRGSRRYTHVAIYIGSRQVIHSTLYLGGMVVISTMEEVLAVYQIV